MTSNYRTRVAQRTEASESAHYERVTRSKHKEMQRLTALESKPGSGKIWQPQRTKARSPKISKSRSRSRNESLQVAKVHKNRRKPVLTKQSVELARSQFEELALSFPHTMSYAQSRKVNLGAYTGTNTSIKASVHQPT
jgi:hypothetical protein